MVRYLIVTIKSWNIDNFKKLQAEDTAREWFLITEKDGLTYERVKEINPRYIFFPHWSWIIPWEIYENFECVVFHMANLPYGRGGSPLQNLIVRGHTDTKVSALRVVEGLDAGDIYMKRDLTLEGSAEEIFRRLSHITFDMIREMVAKEPMRTPQVGEVVEFKRRKPEEGDISVLDKIEKIYDYIRMLDAEGYPRAFLEKNNLRLEFEKAKLHDGSLLAEVKITFKK